jgi:hypothetical protein
MHQAKVLLRELKKFKPLFVKALQAENLDEIEKVLDSAMHLKFEIFEHTKLKNLRFKLKEKIEIEKKLALFMEMSE